MSFYYYVSHSGQAEIVKSTLFVSTDAIQVWTTGKLSSHTVPGTKPKVLLNFNTMILPF